MHELVSGHLENTKVCNEVKVCVGASCVMQVGHCMQRRMSRARMGQKFRNMAFFNFQLLFHNFKLVSDQFQISCKIQLQNRPLFENQQPLRTLQFLQLRVEKCSFPATAFSCSPFQQELFPRTVDNIGSSGSSGSVEEIVAVKDVVVTNPLLKLFFYCAFSYYQT